jgi:hypothetical protein
VGLRGSANGTFTSNAPIISGFTAVHSTGNYWTFSGIVTDEDPNNLTVRLGGLIALQDQSITVGADGTFARTFTIPSGDSGTATAVVTDWWGLNSNTAQVLVNN